MDSIFDLIKQHEIEFVDFRFTDTIGKWHHITYYVDKVDSNLLKEGLTFDGSSIAGWKNIDESDMIIVPDVTTAFVDPFTALPTLIIICDVIDPKTKQPYLKDPRNTAKRAEQYLVDSKIGDEAFFGPELEFFLFDDVRFKDSMNESFIKIDSEEAPYNSGRKYNAGNYGHRPQIKGGYFPVQPVDSLNDIRAEMLAMLKTVGLDPILHHHEVAPSQCELGFTFDSLIRTADNVQKYKYVVRNVAHSYGKTVTFMPKPIKGDNGSGMHVHQSIWHKNKPLFVGDKYGGLSEICLYYIGGIIKHAKALNAFTNPTTNSYKRLVPGFEAPVMLAYSAHNRSASIRIPYCNNDKAKRIEVRFPDPTSNPYYCFAAMLMAGLDGIKNKIHPGIACDYNLYEAADSDKLAKVSSSLSEALSALDQDREFLLAGNVFNNQQIDAYIALKRQEIEEIDTTPTPAEFRLYYSS